MYYVTMTDKRFTAARAVFDKSKPICKWVYECETLKEAEIVATNAEHQGDQKNVNICSKKPSYSPKKYYVTWKDKENDSNWYVPGGVR